MAKEGFFEEVTFEYRHERSEGINPANIWENSVPGKETPNANILK